MKIGIDASRSVETIQKTGVEIMSDHLIGGLLKSGVLLEDNAVNGQVIRNRIDFIFYTPQKISWIPDKMQQIFGSKKLWTVLGLSFEMLKNKPDVLFIPVHTLPFFCPKKIYKIIHDIAFKIHPHAYGWRQKMYLNFDLWRCRRICKQVIVPTQVVKQYLIKLAGFDEKKIKVIPWGYESIKQANKKTRKQDEEKKQILYIGRVEEKKNIKNLIKAFEIFNQKYQDYKLILAGQPGYGFKNIPISKYPNIQYLNYIAEEQKCQLLRESSCLILISKSEGFGIPILEGFDSEIPVIASDIPALREIGGDACLFVNPDNIEDITKGLERIISDKDLRQILVQTGKERLTNFNWEKCVRAVLEVLLN